MAGADERAGRDTPPGIPHTPPPGSVDDVVPNVPQFDRPQRRGIDLVVLLVVLLALALLGAAVGLSLVRTLGIG